MKRMIIGAVMCAALAIGATAGARAMAHHPNLEKANQLLKQAEGRIDAAQRANEFDMGGHAAHAKDLIHQAQMELDQAAHDANKR